MMQGWNDGMYVTARAPGKQFVDARVAENTTYHVELERYLP